MITFKMITQLQSASCVVLANFSIIADRRRSPLFWSAANVIAVVQMDTQRTLIIESGLQVLCVGIT